MLFREWFIPDCDRSRGLGLRLLWFTIALLLGTGLLVVPSHAQQPSPTFDPTQVTTPPDPPVALFGEAIYQQRCASCHGAEGGGDGPVAAQLPGPATAFADPDAIWTRTPAQLFHTTKFGRLQNLMPPWQNELSDAEIWQAVAYAWSLHTSEAETSAGAELYAANCAACHGPEGAGDGPDAPVDLVNFRDLDYAIANSQADWLAAWQAAHPDVGAAWDDAEKRSVLEAIRTFSYTPPWGATYQPGTGLLRGTLLPGSADATVITDMITGTSMITDTVVTLEVYAGFSAVTTLTTTVDATGNFTFTELATDPNLNYLATTTYADIRYNSELLAFTESQELAAAITLYATTDDATAIQMNSIHWIIDPRPGAVVMVEVYSVNNSADRTYVGREIDGLPQLATVAIPVPAAAEDLGFENGLLGGRFQRVGDMAYDTAPILPGQDARQIIMRYLLPEQNGTASVTRTFDQAVPQMSLLVAELPGLEIEIPGFALASRETFQEQTYQLWRPEVGSPSEMTIRLTGLLGAGEQDPRAMPGAVGETATTTAGVATVAAPLLAMWTPWALVAMLVVGLIGAVGWSLQRGRLHAAATGAQRGNERALLIEQIAQLDDQRAAGEVSDSAWQQQRARLKAQLLELAAQERH